MPLPVAPPAGGLGTAGRQTIDSADGRAKGNFAVDRNDGRRGQASRPWNCITPQHVPRPAVGIGQRQQQPGVEELIVERGGVPGVAHQDAGDVVDAPPVFVQRLVQRRPGQPLAERPALETVAVPGVHRFAHQPEPEIAVDRVEQDDVLQQPAHVERVDLVTLRHDPIAAPAVP